VKNVKNPLREYYILKVLFAMLVGFGTAGTALFLYVFTDIAVAVLVGSVFYFVSSLIMKRVCAKRYYKIVLGTNDPELTYELLSTGRVVPTYFLWADFARATGRYQEAINISATYLRKHSNSKARYEHLLCLARSYFELNDIEKLRIVVEQLQEHVATHPEIKPYAEQFFPFLDCYTLLVDGKFSECRALCEEHKEKGLFHHAVICQKTGDRENAEASFRLVVEKFPKYYIAVLAQRHLDDGSNLTQAGPVQEIIPAESYVLPGSKRKTVQQILRCILLIVVFGALYRLLKLSI